MDAALPWLLSGLGLLILLLAGDSLVKGAVNLSLRLGVPALIVSLTIVAFGTSAPELLIAVQAVFDDAPGIAMGNVVGSNTANILLVLGIPALLATMHTSECETKKTFNFMIAASVLFIALAFRGVFDWIAALVLLSALALVLLDAAREAKGHRAACADGTVDADEIDGLSPDLTGRRVASSQSLGRIRLPLGPDRLVFNATDIAKTYGASVTVIGLAVVAVGTSLPELTTTLMASLLRPA
ncbi:MAG: sodium:calcium antiporter, partial [Tateyamaria sp.]